MARNATRPGEPFTFFKRVPIYAVVDECVIWPYAVDDAGRAILMVKGETKRAATLMCERVHGPKPPDKDCAAHDCGDPVCVNPYHLRWATHKENGEDKVLHGRSCKGTLNSRAKLTAAQVVNIFKDTRMIVKIAEDYPVTASTIGFIKAGKIWSNVTKHLTRGHDNG